MTAFPGLILTSKTSMDSPTLNSDLSLTTLFSMSPSSGSMSSNLDWSKPSGLQSLSEEYFLYLSDDSAG